MIDFNCDYNCAAVPEIYAALNQIQHEKLPVYGFDSFSERAKERIRKEIGNPEASVWFLIGGTQTNTCALSALLSPWQGVLSATSGHIAIHESGAIEHDGHKVLTIPATEHGKIQIDALQKWLVDFYGDATWPHMVQPGAVYISHPTELGCLYTLNELKQLRSICDEYDLKLYIDGARLAYALASKQTDVTLPDIAALSDAFYIGGTKCGSLMGEALVFKKEPVGFFPQHKQHGALLAKGFLLGLQFDVLFSDGLYFKIGENAIETAEMLTRGLMEKGFSFSPVTGTNQLFFEVSCDQLERLKELTAFDIWQKTEHGAVVRLVTSWATTKEEVIEFLEKFHY